MNITKQLSGEKKNEEEKRICLFNDAHCSKHYSFNWLNAIILQ